jgi:hypothetical protein
VSESLVARSTAPRTVVVAALVRVYPRLLRWQPIVGAAAMIVAVFVWRYDAVKSPTSAVWLLRLVGLALVAGSVFLLDDASSGITSSSPTPQRLRAGLRLLLMSGVVGVGMLLAIIVIDQRVPVAGWWGGVELEVATMTCVGATFSLTLQRWRGIAEPGQFAGVAVVAGLLVANMVGVRWPLLTPPGPEWGAAHQRWAVLMLLAGAAVIVNLRDPAAPGWRSALRRG